MGIESRAEPQDQNCLKVAMNLCGQSPMHIPFYSDALLLPKHAFMIWLVCIREEISTFIRLMTV